MFREFAVTIPGWLALLWAVTIVLVSLQLIQCYFERADPYPVLLMDLPFVGEEDDSDE